MLYNLCVYFRLSHATVYCTCLVFSGLKTHHSTPYLTSEELALTPSKERIFDGSNMNLLRNMRIQKVCPVKDFCKKK